MIAKPKEHLATIKNLTPHAVHIIDDAGRMHEIPAAPITDAARVAERRIPLGYLTDGALSVRVNRKAWARDGATGIPPKDGTMYIVSTVIAEAFPERDDFLVPDEIERGERGEIKGCHALAQMWPASVQAAREYIGRARDYVTNSPDTKSGIVLPEPRDE